MTTGRKMNCRITLADSDRARLEHAHRIANLLYVAWHHGDPTVRDRAARVLAGLEDLTESADGPDWTGAANVIAAARSANALGGV